jgi:hypothetical protein
MRRLTFHPQFKRDVAAIARRYEGEQLGLGDAFRTETIETFTRVNDFPLSGVLIDADIRRVLLRRFPYHILYVVTVEEIFVLTVAHQHRRPGHWRRRLR